MTNNKGPAVLVEKWQTVAQHNELEHVPASVLFSLRQAFHLGAVAMLVAINEMEAKTPDEATAYLHALQEHCRHILEEPYNREPMQ